MLPAAAAAIHWATLKAALTGWMRCRPSEKVWARPTTSTASRGGSTKMAGARMASNRSSASPWSRHWNCSVGKPAAVSRTRKVSTTGQDGVAGHRAVGRRAARR